MHEELKKYLDNDNKIRVWPKRIEHMTVKHIH